MKKAGSAPHVMKYSPLTLSRSHVLGAIYARCDRLAENFISVYLNDAAGEKLGFVDESLGKYADAFTFHLSEENCKMLAGGKFDCTFDYNFSEPNESPLAISRRRIQLNSIFLIPRKTVDEPVSADTKQPLTLAPAN